MFPCHFNEAELINRNVPAGTTCLRAQLWSAPYYDVALNPVLVPGRLQYPSRNISIQMPPGRVIKLSFPYASHPATGQTMDIRFGDVELPAFPGYFQQWWYVRFRGETRWWRICPAPERFAGRHLGTRAGRLLCDREWQGASRRVGDGRRAWSGSAGRTAGRRTGS